MLMKRPRLIQTFRAGLIGILESMIRSIIQGKESVWIFYSRNQFNVDWTRDFIIDEEEDSKHNEHKTNHIVIESQEEQK